MAVVHNVTLHARDPARVARFWSAVLDYPIVHLGDDLARLRGPHVAGAPDLLVLRADELADVGGRVHLDLAADDIEREVERLVELGASAVDGATPEGPRRRSANGIDWVVLADPEGNRFCVGKAP